jgi:hexosaminidase
MSWRGEAGGIAAAKQHHNVIMSPEYPLYLNHSQTKNEDSITQGGYNPLEAVYNYDPVPKELNEEEQNYILGAQGNVWSEYIDSKSKLEYSIFPRMAALAEVLWTPKEKRSWKDFERRLPIIMEKLEEKKINYSKAYYELETKVLPTQDFKGIVWHVKSKNKDCFLQVLETRRDFGLYDSAEIILHDSPEQGMSQTKYYVEKRPVDMTVTEAKYLITGNGISRNGVQFPFNFVSAAALNKKTKKVFQEVLQGFFFNKATGKKITLATSANAKYPGDGAFTLVNGVQNTAGLSKSSEFLGFNGSDCEVLIDLGITDNISKVIVHALHQTGDWIWKPSAVEVLASEEGTNFKPIGTANEFIKTKGPTGNITVSFDKINTRFIKILIRNQGIIPSGNSGSGSKAWLFVDEIEVE